MTGIIKKVFPEKGFGFIVGEDKIEYFVHRTAIKNAHLENLYEGQEITFEDNHGDRGPRAEDVYV